MSRGNDENGRSGLRRGVLIGLVPAILGPLIVAAVLAETKKAPAPEIQALEPLVHNGVSEYEGVPYEPDPRFEASRQTDASKARIEVRLRNIGDQRTFLTAAVLTVRELIEVAPCGVGAGIEVSSRYDVTLPRDAGPGEGVEVPINQQIAADGADRFVFRTGVEFDPEGVGRTRIYQLDVAVRHDGSEEPAELGTVVVALPGVPPSGIVPFDADRPRGCERAVLADLRRAARLEGARSPALASLLDAVSS